MYEITVEQDFDAAHFLRGYEGKCERQHGHRFRVAATFRFESLNAIGISHDFTDLKGRLGEVTARFDHQPLNEVQPFDRVNPSAENIACAVYDDLRARLGSTAPALVSVTVWEAPEQRVTYTPD
ncbi:MAG: 6-carboxytetrahydropterin synthase [Chloroflexi bacterium]|nr:6-carboxytetrahydropterin synthase [Chloroflexota bacterium]